MMLLDSDHRSVLLDERDARSVGFNERLGRAQQEAALPIACREEFMRLAGGDSAIYNQLSTPRPELRGIP
jgi:hypothetical protein